MHPNRSGEMQVISLANAGRNLAKVLDKVRILGGFPLVPRPIAFLMAGEGDGFARRPSKPFGKVRFLGKLLEKHQGVSLKQQVTCNPFLPILNATHLNA